jgi:hypothetical protein
MMVVAADQPAGFSLFGSFMITVLGVALGALLSVMYHGYRRFLPGSWGWPQRAAAFSLFVAALMIPYIVRGPNGNLVEVDLLSNLLFALIPLIYGFGIVWLGERIEGRVEEAIAAWPGWARWGSYGLLLAMFGLGCLVLVLVYAAIAQAAAFNIGLAIHRTFSGRPPFQAASGVIPGVSGGLLIAVFPAVLIMGVHSIAHSVLGRVDTLRGALIGLVLALLVVLVVSGENNFRAFTRSYSIGMVVCAVLLIGYGAWLGRWSGRQTGQPSLRWMAGLPAGSLILGIGWIAALVTA